ncbi:hypothetical protein [Peribacillus acanthi]|nr:hypothetical protein [Peribacillus acanthi]
MLHSFIQENVVDELIITIAPIPMNTASDLAKKDRESSNPNS